MSAQDEMETEWEQRSTYIAAYNPFGIEVGNPLRKWLPEEVAVFKKALLHREEKKGNEYHYSKTSFGNPYERNFIEMAFAINTSEAVKTARGGAHSPVTAAECEWKFVTTKELQATGVHRLRSTMVGSLSDLPWIPLYAKVLLRDLAYSKDHYENETLSIPRDLSIEYVMRNEILDPVVLDFKYAINNRLQPLVPDCPDFSEPMVLLREWIMFRPWYESKERFTLPPGDVQFRLFPFSTPHRVKAELLGEPWVPQNGDPWYLSSSKNKTVEGAKAGPSESVFSS